MHACCAKRPARALFAARLMMDNRSMVERKILDQVAEAIGKAVPEGLTREVEKNLRAVLQSVFDRLDLVTREELEVQEQVLARTRARLAEMEKKIAELEEKLKKQ